MVRDAVCYILGIMSTDPETNDLLFERFVVGSAPIEFGGSGATDACRALDMAAQRSLLRPHKRKAAVGDFFTRAAFWVKNDRAGNTSPAMAGTNPPSQALMSARSDTLSPYRSYGAVAEAGRQRRRL